MQYTKYIAPPKLKSDFLLGGLTLTELLIGLGLLFLFFSVSVKMAFIVVGIWVVFNVRLCGEPNQRGEKDEGVGK